MNLLENFILIDRKIKTPQIERCWYNSDSKIYNILFKNSTHIYCYSRNRVIWLTDPATLDPHFYHVEIQGRTIDHIQSISAFRYGATTYYHICKQDGYALDTTESEISFSRNCLTNKLSSNVFEYLRRIARENALLGDDDISLLVKQYDNIKFIPENRAVVPYLNPVEHQLKHFTVPPLIYPFGCNASQKKAIQNAFSYQSTIIQGPPGTGKTKTILNIITNILIQNKTVLVVSNNNSATENVIEKLEKCNMGFVAAFLGSHDNKELFLKEQDIRKAYPANLSEWHSEDADGPQFFKDISQKSQELDQIFKEQEELALSRQELQAIELEAQHYRTESNSHHNTVQFRKNLSSQRLMEILYKLNEFRDNVRNTKNFISLLIFKIKWFFMFRKVYSLSFQNIDKHIEELQDLFYDLKIKEVTKHIKQLEDSLESSHAKEKTELLSGLSMQYLKNYIFHKYSTHKGKTLFKKIPRDVYGSKKFLDEYPVILSTTFSSRNCLSTDNAYDYVIIDEASQVSAETGALALSCARNSVIVGDTQQLPNVVTEDDKLKYQSIFQEFNISEFYDCAKMNFLDSVSKVIHDIPQTLLKEHYRCHPKIINFCNQKFYGGELVIMTDDHNEPDVMNAIKTVAGNHARGHMNQREIDVIREEVIPQIKTEDIGIIAPYNQQVDALRKSISRPMDIATVHKFQGREKDTIIMSAVDDVITPFSDDPNLLNVAISRAKKNFYLVVSGNEQPAGSNIHDLLGYIEYNNCKVTESHIRSVYDYLYKQYTAQRMAILKKRKHISEYDSENITYALLIKIFKENANMRHLDVVCHQPMNTLIKDFSLLDDAEKTYAQHSWTHIDFLIFNRVSKKPLLAIEIDGYAFHKKGSIQAERDRMKNHILEIYRIPLLRLSTTGSNERSIITEKINETLN